MNTEQSTPEASASRKKCFEAPKAVAIILAILLCLFTVIGLLCFNVWRILFNPPLVKQVLTYEVVTSDLVPATLEVFSKWRAEQRVNNKESLSGVNEPDIVLLLSFLEAEDWRQIKQLLVTDEFVTAIISSSVDGLYAWIDSPDPAPDINWDMGLFKERMVGQQGVDAIMVAYLKLPIATPADIADFEHRLSQVPAGVEVLYNLCQFPDPWHDDQVEDYVDSLKDANNNIPAIFNFSKEFGQLSSGESASLPAIKNMLRTVRLIALSGWIFALVLLALILLLKVRSRRSLGKYVGIPLIIGGALTVAIALAGQLLLVQGISSRLLSGVSEFARAEISGSLERLASLFFQPLLIQGAVLAGIGLILIVIMLTKRKKAHVENAKDAGVPAV